MSKIITLLAVTGALAQITLADTPISPMDCKENEEYFKCGRDGCTKFYCSDLDAPPFCRDGPCVPSCDCKDGFLRVSYDNDTCIPEDQCERKCKDNEEFTDCVSLRCDPKTCQEAANPESVSCPPLGPNGECPTESGCICSYGFLRDDTGKCIPKEQCSTTCKENEEFSICANGLCYQNCSDLGKKLPCSGFAEADCVSGCVCRNRFYRNSAKACVPEAQCD